MSLSEIQRKERGVKREEAIKILENATIEPTWGGSFKATSEALDIAIEALKAPPISQRSMYQAGYRQAQSDAIETIELVDWYHQNNNKDMVHGANDDEHQAWYKADDVYKALEAVPSANRPKDGDLISRTEAIEALGEEPLVWCYDDYEIAERSQWRADIEAIKSVPSADRPRGEWIDKEELIDAINDAQFVYDSDEGGHKEYDITELVRVIFKDIISNLSSADMRGDTK